MCCERSSSIFIRTDYINGVFIFNIADGSSPTQTASSAEQLNVSGSPSDTLPGGENCVSLSPGPVSTIQTSFTGEQLSSDTDGVSCSSVAISASESIASH
jgi:hypothetical protein